MNTQEISARRTPAPDPPPSQADKPSQSTPRNPGITIRYREDHGVVVLVPNMDQCRDVPYLISQAMELGAYDTGVFKYVLPDNLVADVPPILNIPTSVSKFKSDRKKKTFCRVSQTTKQETLKIGDTDFTPTPLDTFAEILEGRLDDPRAMEKMQYCTDADARNPQDRQRLGLPRESPIWPLKDNQLDRTKVIVPGVHYPYGYVSGCGGSLFTSHKDDVKTMSFNLLHCREKFWFAVARKDGHLIEKIVQRWKCAQKVRHASLWFSRSELKAMGASFVNFVQHANEVVVVFGDIYHHGGTIGYSRAEAVNYAPSGWSIEGYSACSPKCPGYPIPNEFLEFRAPNEPQREQGDEHEHEEAVHEEAEHEEAEHEEDEHEEDVRNNVRKRYRGLSSPQMSRFKRRRTSPGPNPIAQDTLISQMAKSIGSAEAIKQFLQIVRGRRLLELTALRKIKGDDHLQLRKIAAQTAHSLSDKNDFIKFASRLSQLRFAQLSNSRKNGRERIQRGFVQQISKEIGIQPRQYRYYQDNGQKWDEYSKRLPGILCFLLFQTQPFNFSSADWLRLRGSRFDSLKRHLIAKYDAKYISILCSAGRTLEKSLELEGDDVEFVGETLSLDKVLDADLISCLRIVETTDELIYNEEDYPDWPRPEYWPENLDWPIDPTYVPPGEQQCEVCDKSKCQCARRRPKILPRIRIYDGKGRGLQAVAEESGKIAYHEGDYIGQISGRLAPPGTHHNRWSIMLLRDDFYIDIQVEVAQVNCERISNIFKLMNHDLNPTVILVGRRVEGKYRMEVQAARDIYDGQELTHNYG